LWYLTYLNIGVKNPISEMDLGVIEMEKREQQTKVILNLESNKFLISTQRKIQQVNLSYEN
jgi:hypothetical protein